MPQSKEHTARFTINFRELNCGIALVALGFFMPLLITVDTFGVRRLLDCALLQRDAAKLLEAAMLLVLLNALRAVPHYIGAFFIGEAIKLKQSRHLRVFFSAAITVTMLILTYTAIKWILGVHYDFGIPAIMVCVLVILFGRMEYRYISLPKKALFIVLCLSAFQFLDIMPIMLRFPVGRGETSWNVKQAAGILEAEPLLNIGGFIGLLLFLLFSLMIWFQLRDENTLRELNLLREQNQEILMRSRITEMENRTNREVQFLVHDLKSPLTAIQTMTGILRMEREQAGGAPFPKDDEYLDRIEGAVDHMSRMISEILYENKSYPITTQELVNVALAQVSVTEYAPYLRVKNDVPEAVICVNRILVSRALVNLFQNSAQAMEGEKKPEIVLNVDEKGQMIRFTVSDNGRGIRRDMQKNVWTRGVSGRESSGLGLAFVRKTIEEAGGHAEIQSKRGHGTKVVLSLPIEQKLYFV